jgi:hypothetical protein
MRAIAVPLILLGCALHSDAQTDALQPRVDAYIAQVGEIVRDALMPELAAHRELGDVIKEFSFSIDAAGHPKEIKASTTPPTEFLDKLVIRVIRGLKFPPIPKEILEKYPEIEFRTRMGPPGSIRSNQTMQLTPSGTAFTFSMTSLHSFQFSLAAGKRS